MSKAAKRVLALLLSGTIAFSLVGCAENANSTTTTTEETEEAEEETEEAEEETEEAAEEAAEETEEAAEETEEAEEETEEAEEETSTVAEGSTLLVAASSLGSTLNPWDQTDATTSAFQYALYDRLVKYDFTTDENGNLVADTDNVVGNLAESWDTSDDGLVWTFYIDPDATFANGDAVTAEDVIWSLEMCRDNANSSFFFTLTNIQEMEALDDLTVQLTLDQQCNMFLRLLEIYSFCIVNKDEAEAGIAEDENWLTTHTAGSGPYELVSYDTTAAVVMQSRGDDYWGEDKGAIETVTYQLVQEASDRQLLLENGDVDVALDLEDKNIADVAEMDGVQVLQFASNKHLFLCLNNNIEPFDNVLVRQAIAYAIPYDSLVDNVMYGNATQTTSMLPDNVTGHIEDENTYYEYDPDKALELLEEAGYGDGFTIDMTLGNGFTDWEETAVVIQDALKDIGITMNINEIDRAAFLEDAAGGDLQIFLNRFNPFIGDPGYLVNCLYTTESSYNYMNYSNTEFDALYEEAESAATEEERLAIYEEMQYIFAEDCPVVELYQYGYAYCAREEVEGFAYFPDGTLRFTYLSK